MPKYATKSCRVEPDLSTQSVRPGDILSHSWKMHLSSLASVPRAVNLRTTTPYINIIKTRQALPSKAASGRPGVEQIYPCASLARNKFGVGHLAVPTPSRYFRSFSQVSPLRASTSDTAGTGRRAGGESGSSGSVNAIADDQERCMPHVESRDRPGGGRKVEGPASAGALPSSAGART